MRFNESRGVLGGLSAAQIAALPADVREARSDFIRETAVQLRQVKRDGALGAGAFELSYDDPDKEIWWTDVPRKPSRTVSYDAMQEQGWQFDEEGNAYPPGDPLEDSQ